MFLTTNRVGSIDTAFKSRIHLSITYLPLTLEARRTIWQEFIMKGAAHSKPDWFDNEFLNRVASPNLNGRQVKNIVRMGCALAANEKRSLRPADILTGLEALKSFENDFAEAQSKRHSAGWKVLSLLPFGKGALPSRHRAYKFAAGLIFVALFSTLRWELKSPGLSTF
jgi:hypothetical protein